MNLNVYVLHVNDGIKNLNVHIGNAKLYVILCQIWHQERKRLHQQRQRSHK